MVGCSRKGLAGVVCWNMRDFSKKRELPRFRLTKRELKNGDEKNYYVANQCNDGTIASYHAEKPVVHG